MGRAKSVDGSKHNWIEPQYFPSDVEILYLKASQGNQHTDPKVRDYYYAAKDAGKLVSFYHYFEGSDTLQSQLDRLEASIRGMKPDAALAGDFEEEGTAGQVQGFMLVLQDFQDQLVSWKRPSIIYTSPGWWNLHIGSAGLSWQNKYDLWVAQYPNSRIFFNGSWIPEFYQPYLPYGFKKWLMWQWTDKGLMTGYLNYENDSDHYGGDVDKNVINMTLEEYKQYYSTPIPLPQEMKMITLRIDEFEGSKVSAGGWTAVSSPVVPDGEFWELELYKVNLDGQGNAVAISVLTKDNKYKDLHLGYGAQSLNLGMTLSPGEKFRIGSSHFEEGKTLSYYVRIRVQKSEIIVPI